MQTNMQTKATEFDQISKNIFYPIYPVIAQQILEASFPVIIFDKSIAPDLPVPRSFKDLLDPIYEKKISIHGHGDTSCDMSVVMNVYEQYGKEATLTFAKAIKECRHFSQVVKEAGKGKVNLPPIGVIPEMFGHLLENRKNVEVIWPSDGSPLFPLFMTVKKEKLAYACELIDFLTGPLLGQFWADSSFVSCNPEVNNRDYQDKPVLFRSSTYTGSLFFQEVFYSEKYFCCLVLMESTMPFATLPKWIESNFLAGTNLPVPNYVNFRLAI